MADRGTTAPSRAQAVPPPQGRAARVVVLVSGAGTNLQALLDAAQDTSYGATVVAVGADRPDAGGLRRAERHGVPTFVHGLGDSPDRAAWDEQLSTLLAQHEPDLVVCAGFMRLLGPAVLQRFPNRVVNTHPALLPSFPGVRGPADALAYGVKVSGATLFVVDAGVDTGMIIDQRVVAVHDDDDVDALHERIKGVERRMLVDAVGRMARGGWSITHRKVTIGVSTGPVGTGPTSTAPTSTGPTSDPAAESGRIPVRRALVSVFDKEGLPELAAGLHAAGVSIVSTGSTARQIAQSGVPVTAVEDLTGFPECLDGRVKTLHPRVHAGILADRRNPDHVRQLTELEVEPFDLVVVNLYPFARTAASGVPADDVVEQIDIGGPAMVRAAAKNHASVAVVVDPDAYPAVLAAVTAGGFDLAERRRLAAGAFAHTAAYDLAVASWCARELAGDGDWPAFAGVALQRSDVLRYGENPHQQAALYVQPDASPGIAQSVVLHGKPMSYNNYVDADAAVRAAHDFAEPAVAVVKHANPCGLAVAADLAEAHAAAHACDPVSAFGGVVAANGTVSLAMAEQVSQVFTEVVVAPGFDPDALELLSRKKNIRLLQLPQGCRRDTVELRQVSGGMLLQAPDRLDSTGDDAGSWSLVTGPAAEGALLADLVFAWRAVRSVKSNAILLARGGATVGIGMGQVNRVDSCRLAVDRAGPDRATGSVAASDAFFPFADGLQILLDAGVRAVVQPGGSVRDAEVVEAARAAGVTMYLTGSRHFAH